jgi:hypothetical protein
MSRGEDYRFTAPSKYMRKSLIGYSDFKIYLSFFHLYIRVNIHYKKTKSFLTGKTGQKVPQMVFVQLDQDATLDRSFLKKPL